MDRVKSNADLLDALKAAQEKDGCVTEEAIRAIALEYGRYPSEVYETATFYTMLHVGKKAEHVIEVCGSTCCDAAGASELVAALSSELGIACGETTKDGKWMLRRCECLGRCDSTPNAVFDGELVTNATAEGLVAMIRKAGQKA